VSFLLGIDGGGSKTLCLIGDEKAVLGRGASGPSNIVRVGEQRAREAIGVALRQACAAANIHPSQIEKTCIGVAGGARPETAAVVRQILSGMVEGEIEVVGDMVIALEAACGSGPGVIVIAGTGSIAYGRNAAGQVARAGGWGFAISDEGSAHWIGRAAIGAVMRAYDQGRNTALLARIMEAWNAETREKLIMAANATPGADFAGLLPTILAAAESADPIARDVLAQAGAELARLGHTVIARLFAEVEDAPVGIAGGVFRNAALVRQVFYNNLRLTHPKIMARETVVEPVNGALELARKGAIAGNR
jgi:glucosamine kinase